MKNDNILRKFILLLVAFRSPVLYASSNFKFSPCFCKYAARLWPPGHFTRGAVALCFGAEPRWIV
jgi:hypothetical protein